MADGRAIGIFDSGLGGLTVLKEIKKLLPDEDIIYLGDTARVPYGTRSKEIIVKFSLEDAGFLLKKNVKCIVIACNTASSAASEILKKKLKVPVFDVISPALRDAKNISGGKTGVIGTRAAVASGAYKVDFSVACPLLVPFIEEGDISSEALKIIIRDYLAPLKGKVDTLFLGCTHYPIIEDLIQKEMGEKVKLINPEKSVARELREFLEKKNLLNSQSLPGKRQFFVTDLNTRFTKAAEMFLGEKIKGKIEKVNL